MATSALTRPSFHRPSPLLRFLTPAFSFSTTPLRPAAHASEGRANKAAQGPGKRLGAKKAAAERVVPGNIIFKQRGTLWFPGENVGMGRDHTIFAKEKGYVVYYREKWRNRLGERKFIGVVFERGMTLPRREGAKRVRRLGLVGRERNTSTLAAGPDAGSVATDGSGRHGVPEQKGDRDGLVVGKKESVILQQTAKQRMKVPQSQMAMKPGYQFRESNWSIGRAAERAGVKVREYKRGDRFLAWRKKNAAKAKTQERRALGSRKKKSKK